jgi:ribosomal protein S18 acetylase RimI-like enzyme
MTTRLGNHTTTKPLIDKAEIRVYLETDRDYAAYALGDLDEGFFGLCTWRVATEGDAIRALALEYVGFAPPVLFLMGTSEGVATLLAEPTQLDRVYVTAREEHLSTLSRFYLWDELEHMWRMVLREPEGLSGEPQVRAPVRSCKRLVMDDVGCLSALYSLGGGDAFSPTQVTQGVFYGVEQAGQLISVAGTHLVSDTYSVAAIGNVMTHPDHRSCGYATLTTHAVCAELSRRGIQTIVLNVREDNAPAIRVYEELGFVRYCPFYEGVIERR